MRAPEDETNGLEDFADRDVNDLDDGAVDFLQRPWWRWAVMIIVGLVVFSLALPVIAIIWG